MKSVLLGGLKVWLVNDGGKPLSAPGGRAKFYTAGTSTPETVYSDIDLTQADALGPIVYTDELGYLPAIWLKTDRLYKVRVEQKVPGSGNQWTLLWEVDNVGYIDRNTSDEIGDIPIFVNSISELRTVDHTENPVVEVLGYYNPGDWGEPSVFVFDPECVKAPDDGAYVLPSGQQQSVPGRWVQQFSGDVLDVRKFGALPDKEGVSDVLAKIVNAVHYSQDNSSRTRPITVGFLAPGKYSIIGDFNFTQFSFTDLYDQSVHRVPWYIGDGVVFSGTGLITLSKDTVCRCHEKMYSDSASLAVEGGGYIEVDPAWWGQDDCNVSDCYVRCSCVTTNRKAFTRCSISSLGMLGGVCLFSGCLLKQSYFANDSMTPVIDNSCVIDIEDFPSTAMWLRLKDQQATVNYDFRMRTLDSSCAIQKNGVYFKNAIFNGFSYSSSEGVFIDGCSGSISFTFTGSATLDIRNSSITNASPSITALRSLTVVDSTVNGTGFSCAFGLTAYNSVILCPTMSCLGFVDIERCRVSSAITQAQGGTMSTVLKDNMFVAVYGISPSSPGTVFNGVITGNNSTALPAIEIDRTNMDPVESHHSYIYENNTGTFIRNEKESWKALTVYYRSDLYNHDGTTPEETDPLTLCRSYESGDMYMLQRNGHYFDTSEFFSIGMEPFDVIFELEILSGNTRDGIYLKIGLEATFVSGNTWKLAPRRLPNDSGFAMSVKVSIYMPTSGSLPVPAVYNATYLISYRKV